VPPVSPPQTPAPPEPIKQEPPINASRGGWTPYGEPGQETPARSPRDNLRYPDYRTETPKPKLPVEPQPPRPVDDDTPRRFEPEASSMALVQTTGYGMGDAKTPESKADGGPSANKPPVVETASKPWLPLTMALLGLFVSLGGNAYLGLQWWTIRLRCQQLLRDRRLGRGPQAALSRSEDEVEEQADEEDQDVRAISEEDLPRSKRRRTGA
jgi:hypothetical protein